MVLATAPETPAQRPDAQAADEREPAAEDTANAKTIRPGDTLVIEITVPEGVSRTHLLEGRRAVVLDRFGRLTLPGLVDIPLAGLNAAQASLRLRAEPVLDGMDVEITRLTLVPTGRDALQPFGYEIFRQGQAGFYPLVGVSVPGSG